MRLLGLGFTFARQGGNHFIPKARRGDRRKEGIWGKNNSCELSRVFIMGGTARPVRAEKKRRLNGGREGTGIPGKKLVRKNVSSIN